MAVWCNACWQAVEKPCISCRVHCRCDVEDERCAAERTVQLRVAGVPTRWISVTAPVWPVRRVSPARVSRWPEIVRYTTPSTAEITAGRVTSRKRSAIGSEKTHWRSGRSGSISSASSAAVSAMRRAPQEGQKPRFLQLNATSFSAWHCSQRRRRKPYSSRPHFK